MRLARGFGCQGGKFEEFVSRRGNLWSFLNFGETTLVTFSRKRIGVRSKRHSVVLRRDDGSPDWDGMILFGMGARKEADSGHLWKQN